MSTRLLERIDDRYDVVVAGARVAGAATGMLLARAGARVLIVDPARRGSDTLSTHALMRGGVLQLHRWGLLDAIRRTGAPRITATTFHYGRAEPETIPIEPRDGVDGLRAPRRTVLDRTLVEAAEEAGATVVHGVGVVALSGSAQERVSGAILSGPHGDRAEVRADLVIGADGARSRIARAVGAESHLTLPEACAAIYGYVDGIEDVGYHWYYGRGCSIGTIPTNDGQSCVFVGVSPERFRAAGRAGMASLFTEVVGALAPELGRHLAEVGVPKLRGFAGLPSHLRRCHGAGWALVGDAGYFRDPATAHGITDALRDAELLARAVVQGTEEALATYEATRDAVAEPLMRVTARIASLQWELDELPGLHRRLAKAMKAGVEVVRGLDRVAVVRGGSEVKVPVATS